MATQNPPPARRKAADPAAPAQSQKIGTPAAEPAATVESPAEHRAELAAVHITSPDTPAEVSQAAAAPAVGTEKNLLALLESAGLDWDRILREPALHHAETFQKALDLVKGPVLAACWPDLFYMTDVEGERFKVLPVGDPQERPVETVVLNDAGPTSGKLAGRAIFLFADTVAASELTIYNGQRLGGDNPPSQHFPTRKGRAVVVDGTGFFTLSQLQPRTQRTVLLFRLV